MVRNVPRVSRDPVVACLAVATVIILGYLALDVAEPHAALMICWTVMPPADLLLVVLARRVYRMPGLPAAPRRFWQSTAVAGLMFAVGDTSQLLVTIRDTTAQTLTFGAVQSVGAIGGAAVVVAVIFFYPSGIGTGGARIRFFLDAGTILTAAAVIAWCLVARPTVSHAGPDAFLTAILGSGVLLTGVFAAVKLGLGGNSPMTAAAAGPMVVAAGLQGILNIVVPGDGQALPLPVPLLLTLAPPLLFAFGPRIQELDWHRRGGHTRTAVRRRYSLLPYAATVITFGVFVGVLHTGLHLAAWGALAGLILNVGLVVVRQVLALRENGDLLDRLDESLLEITRRQRRLDSLLRHSSDVTSIIDGDGRLTYISPALHRILGREPEEVLGLAMIDFVHPGDRAAVDEQIRRLREEPGAVVTYQSRYRHAGGDWRWLEVTATNLTHEAGIDGIVANARDVTEARELQLQLRHQATHDPLTGLANRRLFGERLLQIRDESVAVLLIDLDDFKPINDTYGHSAGDQVLLHVAACLRGAAGPGDLVARFGGDEFAVLVRGGDEPAARRIADVFRDRLALPADIGGRRLTVRASVGLAAGRAADADELLHAADLEMYAQKRRAATHG